MSLPDHHGVVGVSLHRVLPDEAATRALARQLVGALEPGMVVWLEGGLGAGKTTLVRCLLAELGHHGRVKSPTFTLLEPYDLPAFPVYHFDLYRFTSGHEWRDSGFEEYFGGPGVCLVEWPQHAGPDLPGPDLRIRLDFSDESSDSTARQLALDAYSASGERCIKAAATF